MMWARWLAVLGFVCGVLGLIVGMLERGWKFGPTGWFAGGALLTLLAVFMLIDGALAAKQPH